MVEVFLIICGFVGIAAGVLDTAIYTNAKKKELNKKFETWWKAVEKLDEDQLGNVLVQKVNTTLDSIFGEKHISLKLINRCAKISSGLFLITLALLAIKNDNPFGTTPWKAYKSSIDTIIKMTSEWTNDLMAVPVVNLLEVAKEVQKTNNMALVNINSNLYVANITTNDIWSINLTNRLNNQDDLTIRYYRSFQSRYSMNFASNVVFGYDYETNFTNPRESMLNYVRHVQIAIAKYNTNFYAIKYAALFYGTLFFVNFVLFIGSLAFCRTILREIAVSSRLITTMSLLFTNSIIVSVVGGFVLLLFALLAIPLFWVLIPVLQAASDESFGTVLLFLSASIFGLMITVGKTTKLVICIALLPSIFAIFVGVVALIAMRYRKVFHYVVLNILINCAQRSPLAVLGAIVAGVIGFIELVTRTVHVLSI